MNTHTYVGGELDLFAQADRWKRYWVSRLRPFISGDVLEVGAGIGANTSLLRTGHEPRWLCLEPDPQLAARLDVRFDGTPSATTSEVQVGTLEDLDPADTFDTILYIDVLEHIDDDRGEMLRAGAHLNPGGHLVVLAPAHAWLFSEFDRSVGHHRRYTAPRLTELTPPDLRVVKSFYLDTVGLLASAANRFLLRQSMPNPGQLRFWNGVMVPCSRALDLLTGYLLGKSVVCIWQRPH